jgi:PPOX class probable F420-dependent enzyme
MQLRVVRARVGYLGTVGAAGGPHVVPVCFVLIRDTVYCAVDHKPKRTGRLQRIANIEAYPAACLLVSEYDDDWSRLWWVRLDGSARLAERETEREHALDALAEKYPQYVERRPTGAVIALDVQRWSGWAAG